jgi:hypothetical protein
MVQTSRRQHFIARFYLRNFARPMFSKNLLVYDLHKHQWVSRSPAGVGWFPHLFSMISRHGERTDEFDKFLKREVEDPAAPAMKKLAVGNELSDIERAAVASFIALTAARSPTVLKSTMAKYLATQSEKDLAMIEQAVQIWCDCTKLPRASMSHEEFLKPGSFGAIWLWSQNFRSRLLAWNWHIVTTTEDKPFITSDRPVFAEWDENDDVRLVSIPVSSRIALIIINGGDLNEARDRSLESSTMNRQTLMNADEFIVACRKDFPACSAIPIRM